MQKSIDIEELKKIQIEVCQAIHTFCVENGIKYSLGCGTCLGAARHHGYIPWDDDIDIYLLRKDYNRLIAEFPKIYGDHYELISLERDQHWLFPYAKAYDNRTLMIEGNGSNKQIGVNIDIFPIDDVPDNQEEWIKYDKRRRVLQNIQALTFVRPSKSRSLVKNTIIVLTSTIVTILGRRRFAEHIDKYAQKNDKKGFLRVFETCQGIFQKRPFPKTLFAELIEVPFENTKFFIFKNFDAYLKNGYGDWRKLPPVEKRVTHHAFNAYWK